MPILALYLPQESDLVQVIPALVLVFMVLCGTAVRMRLSVPIAALCMLLGALIAVAPGLHTAMHSDLGDYGTLVRKMTNSKLSDGALATIMYMQVGHGSLIAVAGMIIPLALYFVGSKISVKRIAQHEAVHKSVQN